MKISAGTTGIEMRHTFTVPTDQQTISLIALGANLPSLAGPPRKTLEIALEYLVKNKQISIASVSNFYATPAFPAGSGPNYVNAAAILNTNLAATELLSELHSVETLLGRARTADAPRWQARGVDLDLLAMGQQVAPDGKTQDAWRNLPPKRQQETTPPELILPHPRLQDRAFVLVPLAEIAPGWRHPRTGLTVAQMLAALPQADRDAIQPLTP